MDNHQQINLKNITVSYPGTEHQQLKNLTIQTPAQQIIGIVGPSNSGKTTLCRLLSGIVDRLMHADVTGEFSLGTVNPADHWTEINRYVGYVFQNPSDQLSGMAETVYSEMAFSLVNLGATAEDIDTRVRQLARQFHLTTQLDQDPTTLSGGQMQRLAIACALVTDPPVLIFDDPTSQMDPAGTQQFFDWLTSARGKTIFITSTNIDALCNTVDSLWVLNAGTLVASGTPRALYNHGTVNDIIPDPVALQLARKMGWAFTDGEFPVTRTELMEVRQ
ncbi:energy-coupling factor ABC transporter ATP-binding protein [Lacticaseibacillus zhaodongensis]|uniref:energy-coupling factor ABC transporter ATP-binding protein n=1 Tax=Lacticaseibacillus zhaodongensis TaxID=2668065 RepID=UPI0018AFECE9|nr:ABC transporter ATP-binding protein [Lacticaseibacillus zhaodongensis]